MSHCLKSNFNPLPTNDIYVYPQGDHRVTQDVYVHHNGGQRDKEQRFLTTNYSHM